MNNLLEVKNLSVSFSSGKKQLEVVSGISFTVRPGEILALVGESGCGKSASCLALTGLLPSPPARSNADKILFHSSSGTFDLAGASARQLRKVRGGHIAYVFQEPTASLNPVMRIGAQIAEVLKLHRPEVKDIKAETVSLLTQVGITSPAERLKSYPHELSG
ncbi:MAG: ABC transporter ATP-binding protein, partial [Lentisphaeria bacterium]|nr:ABC transporter ATP-binding protein [Lentisphaeria bacterium]